MTPSRRTGWYNDSHRHALARKGIKSATTREQARMRMATHAQETEFEDIDEFQERLEQEALEQEKQEREEDEEVQSPVGTQAPSERIDQTIREAKNFLTKDRDVQQEGTETVTEDEKDLVTLLEKLRNTEPRNNDQADQVQDLIDEVERELSMERVAEIKSSLSVSEKLRRGASTVFDAIVQGVQSLRGEPVRVIDDIDDFEQINIRRVEDGEIVFTTPGREEEQFATVNQFFNFFEENVKVLDDDALATLAIRQGRNPDFLSRVLGGGNQPNQFEIELIRRTRDKSMLDEELAREKKVTTLIEKERTQVNLDLLKQSQQERLQELRGDAQGRSPLDFLGL